MAAAPVQQPSAVRLTRICKRFGAVQANRDVDLTVAAGSVHGVVGENGAGKSTLMSILYGFHPADTGSIEINGRTVRIRNARHAIALGIGMVHQHFMLAEPLSALDNVMIGAEPSWLLAPARAAVRTRLTALMNDTGLQVRLDTPAGELPVGERQRLEILKALYRGARILILDEPTAVLTPQETAQLFDTLRRVRAQGATVLLVTHKLKEIFALCDAVTVMRAGAVVFDGPIASTHMDALAEAIVGRRVRRERPPRAPDSSQLSAEGLEAGAGSATRIGTDPGATTASVAGTAGAGVTLKSSAVAATGSGVQAGAASQAAPLLSAIDLHWHDALGVPRLAGVSLNLRAGEIVGVAGVTGNGQTPLLEVLSGMRAPHQGRMSLGSHSFAPGGWLDPSRARVLGVAHVPEDRHLRGLVLAFSAWESACLGLHRLKRFVAPLGWMRRARMKTDAAQMMQDYDVRPRDTGLRSAAFSGGNQQKLVLAREAFDRPRVLLVGQPTRGVDIGAIEFIHDRLRAMRDAGGAILLVSSELDEILALSDRVIVMDRGRIAGELPIELCDETALGRLMSTGGQDQPNPGAVANMEKSDDARAD